jgi:uncharacterized protein YkwD
MKRQQRHRARPLLEPLEDRQLLAGQLLLDTATGLLTINGTAGADQVRVTLQNRSVIARLTSNDGRVAQQRSFSPLQVLGIFFQGFEGSDRFLNDTAIPSTGYGGAGNDYLEGGDGIDRFYGEAGNDILVGFGGGDWLRGGAGNDLLFGMEADDQLDGEAGLDQLFGGAGNDYLRNPSDHRDSTGDGPLATVALPFSQKLGGYLNPLVQPANGLSGLESAIITLTNQERRRAGLPPLQVNSRLMSAARHHAQNMGRFDQISHTLAGADLPDLASRLKRYGYGSGLAGENIAWNYPGAEAVVAGWMASAPHRANLLNRDVTEIGVGIGYNRHGEPYYCQVLGVP